VYNFTPGGVGPSLRAEYGYPARGVLGSRLLFWGRVLDFGFEVGVLFLLLLLSLFFGFCSLIFNSCSSLSSFDVAILVLGFRSQVLGFRFLGFGFWVLGFGIWASGFGTWV